MTIQEKQQEVVDEFSMFDDWMQRYEYMIELGKSLPLIDEKYKIEENLIKGCQSKVWVHAELEGDKLAFTADSDAIITKGIVAILIRVYLSILLRLPLHLLSLKHPSFLLFPGTNDFQAFPDPLQPLS